VATKDKKEEPVIVRKGKGGGSLTFRPNPEDI
jgi:hypothetical protein